MFEYDKHYRDCQHNNQPFIKARINPSNGNYYVQIDLNTCSHLTFERKSSIEQLFQDEISFLKSNNPESAFYEYNVNAELCWFDGILSSHLNTFCENLYDLIQKHE